VSQPDAGEAIRWEEEEERLAARSPAVGDPTAWFDQLYAAGVSGLSGRSDAETVRAAVDEPLQEG
jgi:hypothetical protein